MVLRRTVISGTPDLSVLLVYKILVMNQHFTGMTGYSQSLNLNLQI